jgi:hypothetical protein
MYVTVGSICLENYAIQILTISSYILRCSNSSCASTRFCQCRASRPAVCDPQQNGLPTGNFTVRTHIKAHAEMTPCQGNSVTSFKKTSQQRKHTVPCRLKWRTFSSERSVSPPFPTDIASIKSQGKNVRLPCTIVTTL